MRNYAVARLDEIDEVNDGREPISTCQTPLRHHVLRCHKLDGP
jgi:hypothetical protein